MMIIVCRKEDVVVAEKIQRKFSKATKRGEIIPLTKEEWELCTSNNLYHVQIPKPSVRNPL